MHQLAATQSSLEDNHTVPVRMHAYRRACVREYTRSIELIIIPASEIITEFHPGSTNTREHWAENSLAVEVHAPLKYHHRRRQRERQQ